MSMSKANIQMLTDVLQGHMKKQYKYDCTRRDFDLLVNILKDISYKIPRKQREPEQEYIEKVNKTALNEYKRIRMADRQQQPQPSPPVPQQSPAPNVPTPMTQMPPASMSSSNTANTPMGGVTTTSTVEEDMNQQHEMVQI